MRPDGPAAFTRARGRRWGAWIRSAATGSPQRIVSAVMVAVLAAAGLAAAWEHWGDRDTERYDLFGAAAVDVVTLDPMPRLADPALNRVQLGPRYFGARDARVSGLVDQVPDSADLLIMVSATTRYLDVSETAATVTLTGYSRCAPTECGDVEGFEVTKDQVWLAVVLLADPLGGRGVINGTSHATIAAG